MIAGKSAGAICSINDYSSVKKHWQKREETRSNMKKLEKTHETWTFNFSHVKISSKLRSLDWRNCRSDGRLSNVFVGIWGPASCCCFWSGGICNSIAGDADIDLFQLIKMTFCFQEILARWRSDWGRSHASRINRFFFLVCLRIGLIRNWLLCAS